ncbi:MAG: MFS transporter, partial [Chloroflexi bacterium]|nr:MFS transporter [Chloroflexota bacterium]
MLGRDGRAGASAVLPLGHPRPGPADRRHGLRRAQLLRRPPLAAPGRVPFFGGLADRLRPRLMMPVAALALALALALATQVRELWHFYAMYGLVLGAGVSALGMPPHAAIVARWFTTQRGTAYAVLNGGVSLSLLLAGLAQWLTLQYGWRAALVGIGVLLALVVAPLTALLHRGARPGPARPTAETSGPPAGTIERGGPAMRERIGAPEQP